MKREIVKEWIYKAEEDYETVVTLVKKRKRPVPNVVCFHSQQCIEKYLKAYLTSHNMEPPEIHDLQVLGRLCSKIDKGFDALSDSFDILNAYAVNFRYPGEQATVDESEEAFQVMKELRDFIRKKLK